MRRSFTCIRCRVPSVRQYQAWSGMCVRCLQAHRTEGARATNEVAKAIHRGDLKPAREHFCADCSAQARDWDHRDYLRPLDVDAVCKRCNIKRGVAFDSVFRPAGEVDLPAPFVKVDYRQQRHRIEPSRSP